ncbi:MAG: CoA transferase [Pseudomonadota bacterium]
MGRVLEGIRVLDFGRVIASAYCGTLLADMGAEVIRIDRPGGEFDRFLGPFAPNGQALAYGLITPRNKKSITLDIRHPKGKAILEALTKRSDIVVSGFTRQGNRMMGLEYDKLKKINKGIILVAISGFGQNGPYADRTSFDAIAQAESGAMSYTGFPGSPPTRAAVPYVDFGTSILGAYGAMLALFHRERTGRGQMVDVALMDTALTFVAGMGVVAEYTLHKHIRPQVGNHSFYNFTDSFEAKDGWIMISAIGNSIWKRLTGVIGQKDLQDDPRLQDDIGRFENRHLIRPIVSEWMSRYSVAEVIRMLDKARVPCGRVNTAREVIDDPQVKAREALVNVDYPEIGSVPLPGVPIKLSETPGAIETRAARLGEHNQEIYGTLLGYKNDDLVTLKDEGVI